MADMHEKSDEPLACYIAQNVDDQVLTSSASGGAFSAIALAVVRRGGVVFGAVYDDDLRIVHAARDTEKGIEGFRGSKYAQSDMGGAFVQVEKRLRDGREVLFSGTPCQVAGLLSYLEARGCEKGLLENLFTVDFVCHGVGTPVALSSYVREAREGGFDLAGMNMRSKHFGYRSGSMELVSTTGEKRWVSTKADYFLNAFFSHIILRPSCHDCRFKTARHSSDLTLFDSWNAEGVLGIPYDNKGYTNVLVQSEKGDRLLSLAADGLLVYEVSFGSIKPKGGGMMVNSCKPHQNREAFLSLLAQDGISVASKRHLPKPVLTGVKEAARRVFAASGMLDNVTRFVRKVKRGRSGR